jgi:eukaryotic-like serine/threonine-protein kinase
MANERLIVGATVAGKYRIRSIVGSGSMGVVCEAEHLEIGKRVAIKIIDASLAGMNDVTLRFRQEARAASLIESHHIVHVFDVGSDDALGLYLVMEYLVGEDLSKLLARERRLDVETAAGIALQVARGLARAHEVGVVHRDLKPANIFLCAGDDSHALVKILDFGISKLVDSRREGSSPPIRLTRDGMVVGTPQYMSPEQAQGDPVDARTDVWALGLVLYEMLSGRPAYPELPSYERFIIHLVSQPPDPLSAVAPWVSAALANVVHGALEHDLGKRIGSATEFVRRLIEAHPVSSGAFARVSSERPESVVGKPAPPPMAPEREGPRPAHASSLSSSGIRGTTLDDGQLVEDFRDDAPQFFDRKSFGALGHPPAGAPIEGSVSDVPSPNVRATPAPGTPRVPIASRRGAARSNLTIAALAIVALVLVAATALALR